MDPIPIKALIAVLVAWLGAGALKQAINFFAGRPAKFFTLGGMPSVHAAIVASLFLSVYFETGLTLLLLVTGVFGCLVLRDAWGVRWEVSKHSIALNKLTNSEEYRIAGHRKFEVLAGALFGFLIALIVYLV